MRRYSLAALTALCCALFAAVASAQLQQPAAASRVAMRNVYYQENGQNGQTSPSDVMSEDEGMEDESEESEEAPAEEEEDEGPVRLFCPCHCGIQVGGWINWGTYENSDGVSSSTGNLPVLFPQISDGWMLNQAWLFAEKTLPDAEDCCNDWGFRMDYIFGTDGPDTQAFGDEGWDNEWDSSRDYGSAIPSLYAEYGNSDHSIKAGHFYTMHGYEVVLAPGNFFYSHSYTFLYAEPFTHTGVMVAKQLNPQVRASGGYVQGWDSGFNNSNDAHMFMGHVSWTSCDESLTLTYVTSFGDFGEGEFLDDPGGVFGNDGNLYAHTLMAVCQINECWVYVIQSDYFDNSDVNVPGRPTEITAGGLCQYLFWTVSNCMKVGLRMEWFNDDEGARVVTNDPTYAGGDFYAATLGLNYTPNSNVTIRPEIRADWFRGTGTPFADGTADEQAYYGVDFIVVY